MSKWWAHPLAWASFIIGVLAPVMLSVVYLFVFLVGVTVHYVPSTNIGTFEFFNGMVHIFMGSFVVVIFGLAVTCKMVFRDRDAAAAAAGDRWSFTECASATFSLYGVVSAVVGVVLGIWYISLFTTMSTVPGFAVPGFTKAVLASDAVAVRNFGIVRLAVAGGQLAWGLIAAFVLFRFYAGGGSTASTYRGLPTGDSERVQFVGAPMFRGGGGGDNDDDGGAPAYTPAAPGGYVVQTARQRMVGAPPSTAAAATRAAAAAAAAVGSPNVHQATLSRLFDGTA